MIKYKVSLFFCLLALASFAQNKPNVLLIMVDDMNDWVGAFGGHPQAITPNMDALAKKSTVFKQAYCSAALCNPSRTSMLTGYQPFKTGVYGNVEVFRQMQGFENTVTLPQYFAQNGYKTAASGKIFHSPRGTAKVPKEGSDPGSFQTENKVGLGTPYPDVRFTHGINFKRAGVKGSKTRSFDWGPVVIADEKTNDWKTAEYASQFLQKEHDKPFFLACGIFRPHLPLYAPKKYFDMFDEDKIQLPKVLQNDLEDTGKIGQNWASNKLHAEILRNNKWKSVVKGYLASLAFADACVGHLLDNLEKSKYKDNTIIVLMGDHGWHLGEKEHYSKQTLWEESAKTPLIVFDPSKGKQGVSMRTVSLIDVYPTLIDLCGLPKKTDLDGNSFRHLVTNPNGEWNHSALTTKGLGNHTLRNETYRYIVYTDGFEELYDHRNDPMEWTNIAKNSENKGIIREFRKELKIIMEK
ncbi:arylsulfatase A-like enzyme [Wenyingzhuangia heitensis]|uniref:Arylsulfatase A-like enzyme n=1 Tax=Wenyingzhuangia heitensis TaxID=1487859 RepID=A0ABX0UCQ8_9FLAO|nr:sulfatase [Wenyingzhuangia heitensis]NIJ44837.1 arylsulfatase A-like enzyme [Wenyingzhuangia heitensis]